MSDRGWIRRGAGTRECIEAFFYGKAYAPHRHDTYTIALTTHGVQSFNYRGALRSSAPGKVVVLHPDELHDGQAGTERGFGYRSICIAPGEVQRILEGQPLPFLAQGVSEDPALLAATQALLGELQHPLEQAEYDDALFDLAQALATLAHGPSAATTPRRDLRAVEQARDYIAANLHRGVELGDLERVTGQNRWQLSRDFRALLGTSPYRYLVMRRLDRAREQLLAGNTLADVAQACAFADQSHLTRHFKKTYGLAPKRWLNSVRPTAT